MALGFLSELDRWGLCNCSLCKDVHHPPTQRVVVQSLQFFLRQMSLSLNVVIGGFVALGA